MTETVKRRSRVSELSTSSTQMRIFGADTGGVSTSRSFTSSEETTSSGHAWPPPANSTIIVDRGGAFLNRKVEIRKVYAPKIDVSIPSGLFAGSRLTGRIGSSHWPSNIVLPEVGSKAALEAQGTTAIANCSPTKSQAQLGTAIGELREGLPSLIGRQFFKDRAKKAKAAGSEYLNVEFGWKPLVNDIIDSVKALDRASSILTQLARDSGKPVRRRFTFPRLEEVENEGFGPDYGDTPGVSGFFVAPGQTTRRVVTHRDVWFAGSFIYHLPEGKDFLSNVARWQIQAHRLLGLRLDPEVLWNLAPWTWIIDWFGNFGDVVSNASTYLFDGLVMNYGYVMEHVTETVSYDTTGIGLINGYVASPHFTFVRETKRRLGATPFGFGLDDATLSEWQLSILAALGISRRV